jgi:hypothetical protein
MTWAKPEAPIMSRAMSQISKGLSQSQLPKSSVITMESLLCISGCLKLDQSVITRTRLRQWP